MKIKTLVAIGALALAAVIGTAAMIATTKIDIIRVGGPIAMQNQRASDLVADILPPPAYIIEPFMEVTLSVEDIRGAAPHIARLDDLEKQYAERRDLWLREDLPPVIHKQLQSAFEESDAFWREVHERFVPAISRGEYEVAQFSHDNFLTPMFNRHRGAIDRAVSVAIEYQRNLHDTSEKHVSHALWLLASAGALIFLGFAGFCWIMLARVVSPLSGMTSTMQAMALGDISLPIRGDERNDEIGDAARALVTFRQAEIDKRALEEAGREQERERIAIIDVLGDALRHLANGDVSYRIQQHFSERYEELCKDFNSALSALGSALRAVAGASDAIRTGSGEIAQASHDLAIRTEQQAAALEETSATMTTSTSSVRKAASDAKEATQNVRDMHDEASRGGAIVHEAINAMDQIKGSSDEIGQIITLIDNVAFQTNLLALNAAVEAARAGGAGAGFAVVAAEVRNLAQRTTTAANDVKSLITSSAGHVSKGVNLVAQAGETLDRIVERVTHITGLVESIAETVEAESLVLVQVSTSTGDLDQMTQQNAAMVEQSSAAARSLAAEANALADLVSSFTIDMPDNDKTMPRRIADHREAA